jgi:hypothetical protein
MQSAAQGRQRASLLEYCGEGKRSSGGRVVQRPVLYLGKINDDQREAWCRLIEAFDEDAQQRTQLAFVSRRTSGAGMDGERPRLSSAARLPS